MKTTKIQRLQAAFTLIELLVTMAVLAILIAWAAPSFVATVVSNRLTSQINELVGDISYARNEAATRGTRITICVSSDGAACASGDTPWAEGRITFVDIDGDGTRDTGEALLRSVAALSGSSTLVPDGFADDDFISFRPYGGLIPATAGGTFTLCSPSSTTGRQVTVAITGRPQARQIECSE